MFNRHLTFCRPRISSLIKVPTFWGINEFKKSKQSIQQLYCTYFHLGTPSQGPTRKRLRFNVSPAPSVFPVAYFTQPTCHANAGKSKHCLPPSLQALAKWLHVSVPVRHPHCFCPGWSLLKAKSLHSLILCQGRGCTSPCLQVGQPSFMKKKWFHGLC